MIILIALAAAVSAVAVHLALSRLPGPGGTVARFLAVAAVVGGILAAALSYKIGLTAETVSAVLVYAFCCELYLFLITLSLASVSANILTNLLAGPVTAADFDRVYSSARMSKHRVERIKLARLVEERQARLHLTGRGRIIVAAMIGLRRLFGHGRAHPAPRSQAAALSTVIALVFFALMIAPCLAALRAGVATAQFEEAIGYRYFYSLRIVFGHEHPWIPQGLTLGIFQHVLQLVLSVAGFPLDDTTTRINAFVGLNAIFWIGIAAWLLYKLCRELPNVAVGITLASFLYILANGQAAELYWYAYPDYPTVTLALAIGTTLWIWRMISAPDQRTLTTSRMILLSVFAGLAVGNKITNVVYPMTIGILFLLYDRRNFKSLATSGVLSLVVFWLVISFYYLRFGEIATYLRGLKMFVESQTQPSGMLAFAGFFAQLLVRNWTDGLFLLPLVMLVAGVMGALNPTFRPALACLPGAAVIGYFMFQRFYSWSTIEAYLFVWTCWSMLILLSVSPRPRRWGWALPLASAAAVCLVGYDLARRSNSALQTFAAFEEAYVALDKAIAGKQVLNLTAGNTYRVVSTFSSLCKGGTNIFNPRWGDSLFFLRTFPAYSCEVIPGSQVDLGKADAIIFRRLEPDDLEHAIQRNESYFSVSLDEFSCSAALPVPSGDFVACFRK